VKTAIARTGAERQCFASTKPKASHRMAFQRIDLLPSYDSAIAMTARQRWEDALGQAIHRKITDLIRGGAGENFLQYEFESGRLPLLKNPWDLRGFHMMNEAIDFPKGDSFENIDFSYSTLWHSTYGGACFPQTRFDFARLYNIKFKGCLFALANFYGCSFEKCTFDNCDFIECDGFTNCEFSETTFKQCFFSENMFKNCKFDETVKFECKGVNLKFGLLPRANNCNEKMKEKQISGVYRGIKDGFLAGEIYKDARKYLFVQKQSYTRYNSRGKFFDFALEYCAGYGLKPQRVLYVFGLLFALFFVWFWFRLGRADESLLISAGAFLTFGAKVELLDRLSFADEIIYVLAAFLGVSLIASFITVLASVLLKDN
jgi:hypothetical protein